MIIQRKRQLVGLFLVIPLILNYYFWLSGLSSSYVLADVCQKTFWILAPTVSLFAFTQIDSGSYVPSFNKLGLPWQLSYLLEKIIHLICCTVGISSFLLLLGVFLIHGAPVEYRTVRMASIEQSRFYGYHYSWQVASAEPYLIGKNFLINEQQYQFLQANYNRNINVRVQHNIIGTSVTIIK